MVGNIYDKKKNMQLKENINFLTKKIDDAVSIWERSRDHFDANMHDLKHYADRILEGKSIKE